MLMTFDNQSTFNDIARTFFGSIDVLIYKLIGWIFEGIFNLSRIFANPLFIKVIYSRIFLLLGVYMVFKLTFSFITYLIDPDSMLDKQKGVAKIISRTLIMLAMLLIANIIFFNTDQFSVKNSDGDDVPATILVKVQEGVIKTLPNIILGISTEDENENLRNDSQSNGDKMALMILSAFYYENEDEDIHENALTSFYNFEDTLLSGGYTYKYMWPLSTVAGVVLVVILLGIAVDVAIRVFKLIILEVVAPIPIMSYIDPKSSGDGSFGKWLKMFGSTYVEIFLKVGSVYVLILLFSKFFTSDKYSLFEGGLTKIASGRAASLVYIMLIIGLFKFVKDAPKFIKDALGLKDSGGDGLFGGIKSIKRAVATTAGIGAAVGGMIGSGAANFRAVRSEKDPNGGKLKNFGNGLLAAGSALTGGLAGGATGIRAAVKKDGGGLGAALDAQRQRNAKRAGHSTGFGRLKSGAFGMLTGQSLADRDQEFLDANKAAADSIANYKSVAEEEAMKDASATTALMSMKDASGKSALTNFNYAKLQAAMNAKDNNGYFKYTDSNGTTRTYNVSQFDENVMSSIKKNQTAAFMRSNFKDGEFKKEALQTAWRDAARDMQDAKIDYSGKYLGDSSGRKGLSDADAYKDIGAAIGTAKKNVTDMNTSMKNVKHRANKKG